jgi:hypothetical protein
MDYRMTRGVASRQNTMIRLNVVSSQSWMPLEISRMTHLPVRVLGYQGPAAVRKIDFADVKVTN